MQAIETVNLQKTFKGKKNLQVEALRELSLAIAPGTVFGFLGPNGAGKSTTIKILTGQIAATSGTASLSGHPVTCTEARRHLGYLPENFSFYGFMTARETLRFTGKAFGMAGKAFEERIETTLQRLGLEKSADRPIQGFSKGMTQRLGLAQTLVHDPALYILDEPMSGLDPLGRALVKDIIKELKAQGKTVFFSTHITADVEAVCDRVGVIVSGVLRSVERVRDVLAAGLEGYFLQVVHPDGREEELGVSVEALKSVIEQLLAAGCNIERIEPKRQDLETFFLNVIARSSA